jgi:hypothetical protein
VNSKRLGIAAAILGATLCVAYVPDLGHGFIKDDFGWIRGSRITSIADAASLLTQNVGFYRPFVSATFGLNRAMFGVEPFGYGLTNFALLLVGAALLHLVAIQLGLPPPAALFATALWVFNFHGINMALLWISGRTALLLCCTALAAALLALRGRMGLAAVFILLALLSKEEAVVLPFVLALWVVQRRDEKTSERSAVLVSTWPMLVPLALYLALRSHSGAFGPADAPPYYQFTISPTIVGANILEYLDRAATWPLAASLVILAGARTVPAFSTAEQRTLLCAGAWFVCGYALTAFLPVRSSLYAVFPSVGTCLAAAVIFAAGMRREPLRVARATAVLLVAVILLIPVYRARNARWVLLADLSARTVMQTQEAGARLGAGGTLVLIDDPAARINLEAAFGGALPDALALTVGAGVSGVIVPSAESAQAHSGMNATPVVFALRHGELERVSPRSATDQPRSPE